MLAHVHQIPTLLITTAEIPRTREFPQDPGEKIPCHEMPAGVDQTADRPRKARVLVTTVSHVKRSLAPRPVVRTRFRPKTKDQREILHSRDIRQVHNKRRVEVDCQNRDSAERRRVFMSCLACPKTFPSTFDHSGRETPKSFEFIRMISRTSSESDSS